MAGAAAAAYMGVRGSRKLHHSGENIEKRSSIEQEQDEQMLDDAHTAFRDAMSEGKGLGEVSRNLKSKLDKRMEKRKEKEVTTGQRFINSKYFVGFIYVVILINALQMGMQVDLKDGAWTGVWEALEHIFTAVFAIEMVIKLYVLELDYFLQPPLNRWNILDFFIAWCSIIGSWLIPAITGGDPPKPLRVFQFFRLLRMVKVLKMRKDLLALIDGIMNSLKSMFWVGVLLFIVHYVTGIFLVQMIGGDNLVERYDELEFDSQDSFGSLWRAMMTLFSICVVDNWSDYVMPIAVVQPYLIPVFITFLVMTSFGLLNALIGIIVERTTAAIAAIHDAENEKARQSKLDKVRALVSICAEIDSSGDGSISVTELEEAQNNPAFQKIMDEIDLPPGFKGPDLHLMLDVDGQGDLSPEEFINGMYQLIFCNEFQRECLTKHSISQVKHEMWKATRIMEKQIWAIRRDVAGLRGEELPEEPPPDFGHDVSSKGHEKRHSRKPEPGKESLMEKDSLVNERRDSYRDVKGLKAPTSVIKKKSNVSFSIPATSYGLSSITLSKKADGKEDKEGNDGERQAETQSEVPSTPGMYDAEQILLNQEALSAALSALAQERISSDDGILIERVRDRMAQVETALQNLERSTGGSAIRMGSDPDLGGDSPGGKKKVKRENRSNKSSVRVKKKTQSDNPVAGGVVLEDEEDQASTSLTQSYCQSATLDVFRPPVSKPETLFMNNDGNN